MNLLDGPLGDIDLGELDLAGTNVFFPATWAADLCDTGLSTDMRPRRSPTE